MFPRHPHFLLFCFIFSWSRDCPITSHLQRSAVEPTRISKPIPNPNNKYVIHECTVKESQYLYKTKLTVHLRNIRKLPDRLIRHIATTSQSSIASTWNIAIWISRVCSCQWIVVVAETVPALCGGSVSITPSEALRRTWYWRQVIRVVWSSGHRKYTSSLWLGETSQISNCRHKSQHNTRAFVTLPL